MRTLEHVMLLIMYTDGTSWRKIYTCLGTQHDCLATLL